MAPSPAAGKTPQAPKTPTKLGKSAASNQASKLGQPSSAADSAKDTASSATNTPKQAAGGPADQAKSSAGSKSTSSPKLPPRPKAGQAAGTPKGAASNAPKAPGPAGKPVDDAKKQAEDTAEDTAAKTDDAADDADNEDTDNPVGKVSQPGNETGEEGSSAVSTAEGDDNTEGATTEGADDTADEATEGATGSAAGAAGKAQDTAGKAAEGDANGAAGEAEGAADDAKDTAEGATEDAKDTAEDATEDAKDTAEDATEDAKDTAEDATEDAKDTAKDAKDTAEDAAEDAEGAVPDEAGDAVDDAEDQAEDAVDGLPEPDLGILKGLAVGEGGEILDSEGNPIGQLDEGDPEDLIGKEIGDDGEILDEDGDVIGRASVLPEKAEELANKAKDGLPAVNVLEGLEVGEDGEILGPDGTPLGKITDGNPEDLVGLTLNENGEILDEDGDVIGRAEVVPGEAADKLKEQAAGGPAGLGGLTPDLSILAGKKVNKKGNILDDEGEPIGKLTEDSDPKKCAGKMPNEKGLIIDDDGGIVGKVEVVPGEAADEAMKALHPELLDELKDTADEGVDEADEAVDEAAEEPEMPGLPGLDILEGLKVNKKGEVLNEDGEPIAKLSEGELDDCKGKKLNANGEIVDADGNVIGKVELIPEAFPEAMPEEEETPGLPGLDILDGLKVNKKGEVLNEDGEPIAKLSEGELDDCKGKKLNANGEVVDADGNVVGKVELIPEAFPEAMPEEEETPGLPGLDILEGLKVNKKGEVLNEDGEPIAKLSEGELDDCKGKKLNANGEVVDADGNVVGKVELIPEAFPEVEEAAAEAAEKADLSELEGLKVNKKGEVVNEDGEPIARLVEGELADCTGKKLNAKGEILDAEGNVIGKVEMIPSPEEEAQAEAGAEGPDLSSLEGYKVNKSGKVVNEDGETLASLVEGELDACAGKKVNDKGEIVDADGNVIGRVELDSGEPESDLPPLSILEGCTCNKNGKIVDSEGNPKGELIEGDAKRLNKMKAECDDEGQFWDGKGHVIGRAQTLPIEESEEEAPFAGLEGLIVVPDGFVEDENQNKVGQLVEGDPKKLVGRAVDEDGDVVDKHGNTVGHAERLPEEEAEAPPDLSVLEGLTLNKQGNLIGPEGVPIGRLVEGNAKELAGKKSDAEGQIWNDSGSVIGRCELIPPNEREAKPEGPFAGLEGCVVVKDGWVEDEEGNQVGTVVEGDAKKLIGRAVDEDGDIIDKYGNVKGHAERYEEPEEEVPDLSSLEGKVVNKSGNVVDEHGTIYGRIAEGDPAELAGKKVDGLGQIWNDNGKVIGQAELIPGGGTQKPEGPFAGFENLVVAKDGFVTDGAGQVVGKLVEGSDEQKLLGRKVDADGDILDSSGNPIGHAERYTEEEKPRNINPMSGHKVNHDGEVRDDNGELLGMVTDGHLPTLVGLEVDDNGYVVDNDGNKVGECTLMQNIPEDEDVGPTEEEIQKAKDAEVAKKMNGIVVQTIEKMQPICKDITDLIEAAERKPKEELDEEELVKQVKPKIEEGNRILQECNGAIRGLDPDGSIAQNAKARAASGEATKEEHQLANSLKELTSTIVTTIENAKKKLADMPHAKKELNPLWYLLSEPLFQIIAAVGLLLSGVLGLVGKLLNGLGLGGLVNGLLGGLGIDKLLGGLGLGSIAKSLGLGGGKK